MAWIEFHQTMPRHKKTVRLARELKLSRREAVGLMCDLWCWALDNADKDGTLTDVDAEDIADAMDYPRKQGDKLVDALITCGYMDRVDGALVLHDWYDYAGKLSEKRETDKKRKAAARANKLGKNSEGCPQDVQRMSSGNPLVTVPNHIYTSTTFHSVDVSPPTPSKVKKPEFDLEARLKDFSPPMQEALRDWLSYKAEKRQGYKPTGLKSFLSEAENNVRKYGETTVVNSIRMSMAANYQGVVWDKASQQAGRSSKSTYDPAWNYPQNKYSDYDLKDIALKLDGTDFD